MSRRAQAGWLLGLLAVGAAGASVSDAALIALFPKPPATVAWRAEGDLDGDGAPELAVLYEAPLAGRYRLAVVRVGAAGPTLAPQALKPIAVALAPRPVLRDVTGDGLPEIVLRGARSAWDGVLQVFALRPAGLTALLTLDHEVGREPLEVDLDGDGAPELLDRRGLLIYDGGPVPVRDETLVPHRYAGERFEPSGLRAVAGPAGGATARLRRYVAARLWSQAVRAAEEAERLGPGPATAWNRALIEQHERVLLDQAQRCAGMATPEERLAAAIAALLAGDPARAVEKLATFERPAALPVGWELAWTALRPIVEELDEVGAAPATSPVGAMLLGLVRLAEDRPDAAREVFARAAALQPDDRMLRSWATVGLPGARLYYVGADGRLRAFDVSAGGAARGFVPVAPEPLRARAVAGCRAREAFCYVPPAGDQVVLCERGDSPRVLLRGEYFYLAPQAISPDGRFVAVDIGAGEIRELRILEAGDGRTRGRLTYAGRYLWSPDSRSLAVELPVPVEPPLPWPDGGTREVALVSPDGKELGRPTAGDAQTLWSLESWPAVGALIVRQATLARRIGEVGDGEPTSIARYAIDPRIGRRWPAPSPSQRESDQTLAQRRLGGRPGDVEVVEAAYHPRYVVCRRRVAAGAELWLVRRDAPGEIRVGPAPPLESPVVASWGWAGGEGGR